MAIVRMGNWSWRPSAISQWEDNLTELSNNYEQQKQQERRLYFENKKHPNAWCIVCTYIDTFLSFHVQDVSHCWWSLSLARSLQNVLNLSYIAWENGVVRKKKLKREKYSRHFPFTLMENQPLLARTRSSNNKISRVFFILSFSFISYLFLRLLCVYMWKSHKNHARERERGKEEREIKKSHYRLPSSGLTVWQHIIDRVRIVETGNPHGQLTYIDLALYLTLDCFSTPVVLAPVSAS